MTKLSLSHVVAQTLRRLGGRVSRDETSTAAVLMRSAERYEGRAPVYAQDLRRAAQASLMLNTGCQF